VLAICGVLLLAAILFVALTAAFEKKVVWLTPTELARSTRAGPFTQLKQKLASLTPSFVWRFWRRQPAIQIDSSLLTLSAAAAAQTGLGVPVATNANGMRAWILSPAELDALQQRLKTIPDATLLSRPSVQTLSGRQAQVQVVDLVTVAGKSTPVGLIVDLFPRAASGSVKLTMSATSTERFVPHPGGALAVRTNFAAACRVFIKSTGGLVVDGGDAKDSGEKSHWIIIHAVVLDAQGKPIKP
jgi:hypothetical protein